MVEALRHWLRLANAGKCAKGKQNFKKRKNEKNEKIPSWKFNDVKPTRNDESFWWRTDIYV